MSGLEVYQEVPFDIDRLGTIRWRRAGNALPPPLETKPARAALANRDNAPFKVMVCGTSVSEGTGPAGPFTNRWIYRFQNFLRGAFPIANVKGGVGYLPCYFEGGQPDPPCTVDLTANTGGTSTATKNANAGLGARTYALKNGAALVYTQECTSFDVFYTKDTFSVNANVFIDGVAAGTITGMNSGTLSSGFKWNSGALDPGVHVVKIQTTDTAGFYSRIEGVHFYYRDETKGIWVIDATKNGASVFLPTMDTIQLQGMTTYLPDVVIVEYLTNDFLYDNGGAAAYYTNLTNWVNKVITAQGSKRFTMMFIINPTPNAAPTATHGETHQKWRDVIRRVAGDYAGHATCRPVVVDWTMFMGDTVAPDQGSSGDALWNDPAHLSIKGNAFVSDLMATALGAIGGGKIENDLGIIRIPAESANPGNSPAGELNLFARTHAGRIMPRVTDPGGLDWTIQPHLGMNNIRAIAPASGTTAATAFAAIGTAYTAAQAGTGMTTANPVLASTNLLTSTRRVQFLLGTASGGLSQIRENVAHAWRGNAAGRGGFHYVGRFGHETRVPERTFVGLQEGVAAATSVDPLTTTALSKVGMAHNASTGNWRLIHNAAGTTPTAIDLGASFAVNTTDLIELTLFCPPQGTTIGYRVSLLTSPAITVSGTLSTNLPVSTTFMSMFAWAAITTAANATLSIVRLYLESDN